MITLITGVPGSGKTLKVVSDLAGKIDKEYKGKKIYVDGITDLAIDVTPIPDGHTIKDFNDWVVLEGNRGQEGALIIIDEAQRVFPPRSSGSAPSPLVEFLHVHRHYGVDIILITQKPMRIDKQVRDLVGAHYHIHKNPLGMRVIYFWDYCADNPKTEMKNGKPSVYKLNKKAYQLYKSAELHTKVSTPKSRVLYILPLSLIGFVFFIWLTFKMLYGFGDVADDGGADVKSKAEITAKNTARNTAMQLDKIRPLTDDMFVPNVKGRPESKPIYDAVRQVKTFEYPVACISGGLTGCTCYTHQGTAIKEIDKPTCNIYVKDGLPFNPYKDTRQIALDRSIDNGVRGNHYSEPEVLVMGGKSPKNLMYDDYLQAGEKI